MLAAKKIKFETVEYVAEEVGENFGEHIAELVGIPPKQSFKTLVARGDKTGILVAVIPVCDELDLKKLAAVSHNKSIQLIHVKELLGLTGYIRGGVSPIGMKKKYPTYIDESVRSCDFAAVSGGVCGITLKLAPSDLIAAVDAVCADITRNTEV